MWFNILKIEDRRAAYRFFINSMVHRGELIPPKPPGEILNEGGIRLFAFETPNGHFDWEVEYYEEGKMGKFYLASVPSNIEPYIDYIEGMFEQEYPEQYAALEEFFKENAPPSGVTEGGDSDSGIIIPKSVFRKMRSIFIEFRESILEKIEDELPQMNGRNRVMRYMRQAFRYNTPTILSIQRQYELGKKLRRGQPTQYRFSLLQAVYIPFISNIRENHHWLVWEHIANLYSHFRDAMLRDIKGDTEEEIFQSILNYDLESAHNTTIQLWERQTADKETFMQNLPILNI